MDLDYFIDRLSENRRVFESLLRDVTDEQAQWKPIPEKWSMLEVVNHLYDEEREDFRQRLGLTLEDPEQPWPTIDPLSVPRTKPRTVGPGKKPEMTSPIRILLQTTIPFAEDNWHIGSFSLLRDHLRSLKDDAGNSLYEVTTRDRETDAAGNDPVLSTLDASDFGELWLFAIDTGDGLSVADCQGITRFRQRGGGILTTRDHEDLGTSLCTLGGIGAAHFFHSKHPEPDASRHVPDDPYTTSISWPNYHSGANGDYQTITVQSAHEVMRNPASAAGIIEFFPAHPHEGAVGVPEGEEHARVIATGQSKATGRPFNLIVAFESARDSHGNTLGRGIAESSFHHFVDYNWDPEMGCPSFVEEPPGDGYKRNPQALEDIKTYVGNVARWLAPGQF